MDPKLFNEGEKKDFKHLIDVMVDFNLNYIQHRSTDGTYSYQLDPWVNSLGFKDGLMDEWNLNIRNSIKSTLICLYDFLS